MRMFGRREALERPGLGRRLCCIAIAGIMLASILGMAIDVVVPDALGSDLVVTETPASGTPGPSVTVGSQPSIANVTLLNDNRFNRESGWRTDFYLLSDELPRIERTARETGLQLDLSNVAFFCYYEINVNLRDYETITLSLDLEVLRGPIELGFGMDIFSFLSTPYYHDGGDEVTRDLATGDSTTIAVELDMNELYGSWLPLWLAQGWVRISIYPVSSDWWDWVDTPLDASIVLENITVSATTSTPLAPLHVDIQNTEGFSIYESGANLNWREWPAINLTRQEIPTKWGILLPWRSNDTIYVAVGNYSGIAGIYSYDYANDTYSFSFEIQANSVLHLGLRFEMVRVSLTVSPDVPYLWLSLWSSDVLYYDYGLVVASPFPQTLYIPKRDGTLIISLAIPHRVEGSGGPPRYRTSLVISESVDIAVQLNVPLFPFFGVLLSTGEVLLVIFGLTLLAGAMFSLQRPGGRRPWSSVVKDPRFWPIALIGFSIVLPWFVSFWTLENLSWSMSEPVFVMRSIYSPFALGTDNTGNSLANPVASRYMITEIIPRIILFWLPLKLATDHVGRPGKWRYNSYYATCILLPLIMGVLVLLFTPIPLVMSIGFFLVLAAPILWSLEILIYRGLKKIGK
ncbi:MAG: hypothetical protein EAX95_03975 [Candidatus Thorarchaeota archaeon]|nr:hypothetical protein [Candidatus Thorarchaeota archaeon]